MSEYKLKFLHAAKLDIRHARIWYNIQREHLGDEFLLEIEKVQAQIQINPKQFPKIRSNVRKAVLKRFPYNIFFSITPDAIKIIAVFHNSRNPIIWQKRAR